MTTTTSRNRNLVEVYDSIADEWVNVDRVREAELFCMNNLMFEDSFEYELFPSWYAKHRKFWGPASHRGSTTPARHLHEAFWHWQRRP